MVSASIPNFLSLPSRDRDRHRVDAGDHLARIRVNRRRADVRAYQGTLGASQHGGVQVHLVSSDPSRVLLGTTNTSSGAAEIDIPVANGSTSFTFFVVGTDWIDGVSSSATVTVTATASGFTSDGRADQLHPARAGHCEPAGESDGRIGEPRFQRPRRHSTIANNRTQAPQWRRPGSADLVITITNSNAGAAEIDQNGGLNGAQVQTARIVAGQSSTPFNAAGVSSSTRWVSARRS